MASKLPLAKRGLATHGHNETEKEEITPRMLQRSSLNIQEHFLLVAAQGGWRVFWVFGMKNRLNERGAAGM